VKHFIDTKDLTKEQIDDLLRLSEVVATNPREFESKLKGRVIATIFFEPSTRTRLSFESAIARLGASNISVENANESSSAGKKGESIEDTIKMLCGYADAIVMRHPDNDSARRAVAVSSVPFVNGGSGSFAHPSQSLLDAYTIWKHRGSLDNVKIAVCGDLKFGRTANSLIKLLSKYNNTQVWCLSNKGMEFTDEVFDFMKQNNIPYTMCKGFADIPADVDVIYQTRFQKERAGEISTKDFVDLTITNKVMERFGPKTIVLHPLPRVDEIATEFDSDPRAMYFQQAANGIPTRMAILVSLLCNDKVKSEK